jgi:hypothetical protein
MREQEKNSKHTFPYMYYPVNQETKLQTVG